MGPLLHLQERGFLLKRFKPQVIPSQSWNFNFLSHLDLKRVSRQNKMMYSKKASYWSLRPVKGLLYSQLLPSFMKSSRITANIILRIKSHTSLYPIQITSLQYKSIVARCRYSCGLWTTAAHYILAEKWGHSICDTSNMFTPEKV